MGVIYIDRSGREVDMPNSMSLRSKLNYCKIGKTMKNGQKLKSKKQAVAIALTKKG